MLAAFAIVFLWQLPHFMAIVWMYREDYARAGYVVLPAGKSRDHFVACKPYFHPWHFSQWLWALQFGVSLGIVYLAGALVLGGVFLCYSAALLFKCPPFLHGGCFLLPSSIFRCCLLSSRRTRNEYEEMPEQCYVESDSLGCSSPCFCFPCPPSRLQCAKRRAIQILSRLRGLKEDQIAAIRNGRAVAKVVESRTPDEVFVFGSAMCSRTPEQYLKLAST